MMRLDYKRFGTTVTSSAWETGADAANNLSYVYATFTQTAASNTYNQSGSAYYNISCDGKSTGNVSFTFGKGSTKTFSATLGPYYHAADGSLGNKTVTIVVHGDVNGGNHTQNVTVSFTKFARGFSSIPTLTLDYKTASSFGLNWSTSESASEVWWDLYNSSGTKLRSSTASVGSGTSGSFEIGSLSGNTTYKVQIRAKRSDSGLWDNGTSNMNTYTTYINPTLSISLVDSTETSLKIRATPNVAVASKTWSLELNGTEVKHSSSTAETVEFTGLTANKTYTLYCWYTSTSANGSLSSATYMRQFVTLPYPSITAVSKNPLTIGQQQTVTVNNPKNRNITIYMKKTNTGGTTLHSFTTTSKDNISFTPSASTLYTSLSVTERDATAVYYCVYNDGTAHQSATVSGKYQITGNEVPTFTTTNWSYTANLTELTNNNQVIIKNYSAVTFKLDAVATPYPNVNSEIKKYETIWDVTEDLGGTTVNTTHTITGKSGSSLGMRVADKRDLSTLSTRTLVVGSTFIEYTSPTVTSISTHRTDGIQAETTLDMNGKFYATNFGGSTGSHTNTLYSIQYYTKPSNSSTWSGPYSIPLSNFTINTSTGAFSLTDFQIHADGESGGFVVGTRYNIKVEIKDAKGLLATATNTSTVTDGKIARDVYQDSNGEYHEGINGRADSNYTQKVNGNIGATGDISTGGAVQKSGTNILRNNGSATVLSAINNQIVFRPKGDGNTANQATVDTDGTLTLQKGAIGPLVLKRTEGANASTIRFENTNGMLGAIGMTGAANGRLQRWNKDYATGYEIIDRSIVTNNTSKTHTNYNNNQTNIPTMNTLTFWNGAYNSSGGSNLTYCAKGAFGDACVKAVTTSVTENSAALLTSGGAFTAYSKYYGGSFNSNSCSISYYRKGNVCSVRMNIYEDHTFAGWANTTIGTLPAGYRPTVTMTMAGQVQENTTSHFYVLADGKINLFNWAGQKTYYGGQFEMSATYVIGN